MWMAQRMTFVLHALTFIAGPLVLAMGSPPALGGTITGRSPPSPIYGVTLDDVSKLAGVTNSLSHMAQVPTVRIVFGTGVKPSYYVNPIKEFRPVSYIMGQLIDSSYMKHYKTVTEVQSWTQSYTSTLGSLVDIWEVGNEVNGNWLSRESDGADVLPKIEAMYDIVSGLGGATAITFFYEGEPSDPNNCIATSHGGDDMFTWINQRFQLNLPMNHRPAETEEIRLNVDYVLVSWYPDQCSGAHPGWPWVFTQLANIFPNSKVGFGELGTVHPQYGSSFEINEIKQYYAMAKTVSGFPPSYIGGYFWWYFAEEMVPWGTALSTALNATIQ
jgi:hypothetical protein